MHARNALAVGSFQTELQLHLGVILYLRIEFLEEKRGLHISIVLIFITGVLEEVSDDFMIENLADRNARVDSHRLHGKHLQRPEAAETDVAETTGRIDKKPQTGDATSALKHRH